MPNELNTFNNIYYEFASRYSSQEPFIFCDERTMTLGELSILSDTYVIGLSKLGVKKGSCVGYTMPNCPEIIALVIAVSRMGACAVPVFHMVPDMGKAGIFKNSRAGFIVTTSQQAQSLRESLVKTGTDSTVITIDGDLKRSDDSTDDTSTAAILDYQVEPSMPLLISSSSGTTGVPKAVMWMQSNVASLLKASMAMAEPITANGKIGSSCVAFPLASAGIMNLLGFMFAGVRLVFSSDVSPVTFINLLNKHKPDSMAAPPAYYEGILTLPMLSSIDTTSIQWIFTGMDFFSPLLLDRLREKFPNVEGVGNGYGLIETTNVFMLGMACKQQNGVVGPTSQVKVVDGLGNQIEVRNDDGVCVLQGETGELYVKGTSVIRGYPGNPDETSKSFVNGWFKTGDVVRNDGNNVITLLGRKKYLIKRGGKSVSPIFVQDIINKLPGVKASAVVGVPHPLYGEMVWAFVAAIPGMTVELKEVMKHCRTELVNYMVPDQVRFVDDIPKKPGAGKIDFEKMIQIATEELVETGGGNNG